MAFIRMRQLLSAYSTNTNNSLRAVFTTKRYCEEEEEEG